MEYAIKAIINFFFFLFVFFSTFSYPFARLELSFSRLFSSYPFFFSLTFFFCSSFRLSIVDEKISSSHTIFFLLTSTKQSLKKNVRKFINVKLKFFTLLSYFFFFWDEKKNKVSVKLHNGNLKLFPIFTTLSTSISIFNHLPTQLCAFLIQIHEENH
jgi:hypothetical protein